MITRSKRLGGGMLAAMAAVTLGQGIGMKIPEFGSRIVAHRRELGSKLRQADKQKFDGTRKTPRQMRATERRQVNREGRLGNIAARLARIVNSGAAHVSDMTRSKKQNNLINKMSNWQNHQWIKARCPMDMTSLERFVDLPKKHKNRQYFAQAYVLACVDSGQPVI